MKRLEYLDAIRGLAAMSVVVYHFIGWKWADKLSIKTTSIFINGADAVSFFFVLSGFVLSYKFFQSKTSPNIPKFLYKRVLRLYPAFLITVLINYLYWNRHGLNWSLLADMFYKNDQKLWQELIMVRGNHKFYIPGWSMGVEMVFSLLMPFLIILAQNNIKHIKYLLPICLFIGHDYLSMFFFHFLLGMLLAYYYPEIRDFKFKETKWYRYRFLLLAGVLMIFSARHLNKIFPFGDLYERIVKFFMIDFFHFSAAGSFLILLYVINTKWIQDFLENRLFLFIGKISYSIYLMHWIVVVYIMEHWKDWSFISSNEKIVFLVMLTATIAITLVLATILYYVVEKVFIQISYKTSNRLFPKKASK